MGNHLPNPPQAALQATLLMCNPEGPTDKLLGTHWGISPSNQHMSLPRGPCLSIQVRPACKKASAVVGVLAAQHEGWRPSDQPDHQVQVPARKAGPTGDRPDKQKSERSVRTP